MQPVPKKPPFKSPSLSARFIKTHFFTNHLALIRQLESWVPADLSPQWQIPGYLPPSQSRRTTPPPPPLEESLFLRLVGNNQTLGGKSCFTLAPLRHRKEKSALKRKGGKQSLALSYNGPGKLDGHCASPHSPPQQRWAPWS